MNTQGSSLSVVVFSAVALSALAQVKKAGLPCFEPTYLPGTIKCPDFGLHETTQALGVLLYSMSV